jgi:hypothetical protein
MTYNRTLKKSASAEKVKVQAKVEATMRTSDLRSTLTSTAVRFTRCGLAWDKARLGAPGLGG